MKRKELRNPTYEEIHNLKSLIGKEIFIGFMDGESHYCGRTGVIEEVDDMNQLHGTWGGLAVIPFEDEFKVID